MSFEHRKRLREQAASAEGPRLAQVDLAETEAETVVEPETATEAETAVEMAAKVEADMEADMEAETQVAEEIWPAPGAQLPEV